MHVPWPGRWETELVRVKVIMTGLAFGGAFCLLVGGAATLGGDYGIGLMLLLVSVVLVSACVMGYLKVIAPRNRGGGASTKLELPGRSVATVLGMRQAVRVGQTFAWLVLVVFLFAFPPLIEMMPVTGQRREFVVRAIAPLLPLFTIPLIGLLLSRVVRRRGLLGVGLSAEGVYHWWWFGCSFFAWEWVEGVRASEARELAVVLDVREPLERPANEEENFLGRWDYYRRKRRKFYVGYLAVNPAVAYLALAFYQRHPELRSELGTDASVERIQRMDFPELVKEIEQYGDLRAPTG